MSSSSLFLFLLLLFLSSFASSSDSLPSVLPFFCSTCRVSCGSEIGLERHEAGRKQQSALFCKSNLNRPAPAPPHSQSYHQLNHLRSLCNPTLPPIRRHSLDSVSLALSSSSSFPHRITRSYNRCLCQQLTLLVLDDTLTPKESLITEPRNASQITAINTNTISYEEYDGLEDDIQFGGQEDVEEYENRFDC